MAPSSSSCLSSSRAWIGESATALAYICCPCCLCSIARILCPQRLSAQPGAQRVCQPMIIWVSEAACLSACKPDKSAAGFSHPTGQLHLTSTVRTSECCSLDTEFGGASSSKRRRVRHQHFWRNSDKLPPDHRLYVASADIKLALEEVHPLHTELSLLLPLKWAYVSILSSFEPFRCP